MTVGTWETIPRAKFCKLLKGIYPFRANIYQKLPFFCDFGGSKPTFLSHSGKIWLRVQTWKTVPMPDLVKSVKGIYPFWANAYQKVPILAILRAVSPHF